jgi:hypothetical protein
MITTRALVERNATTMRLITHHESRPPLDPALRRRPGDDRSGRAPSRRGGPRRPHRPQLRLPRAQGHAQGRGAALPWKTGLFREIVTRRARGGDVPLTVKMRKGIDSDHLTFLDAGRIAEDAGVAAVALHARTAAEFYSGHADWAAIAALKQAVTSIPVLGNGDIWSADDAVRMMAETGCDGVVVGRGCLGRPWLFGDLAAAFGARGIRPDATLGFVAAAFRRHAELLVEFFEDEGADAATSASTSPGTSRAIRSAVRRAALATVSTLAEIDDLLATLDLDAPYPVAAAEGQRGRAGTPKRPACPTLARHAREMAATTRGRSPTPNWTPVAGEGGALGALSGRPRATTTTTPNASSPRRTARSATASPATARAALGGAAPSRGEDAGAEPREPRRLRPQPAHALARGRAGGPRAGDRARALARRRRHRVCLSHDIGHPPFGHNGERAQRVGRGHRRVRGQRPDPPHPLAPRTEGARRRGSQASASTSPVRASTRRASTPGRSSTRSPTPAGATSSASIPRTRTSSAGCEGAPGRVRCIEAEVMDLSDDIAYSVHDFEDAVLNGYLDPARLADVREHEALPRSRPGSGTASRATSSRTPCTASPGCRSG